jgi:hypothetical protein
MKTRVSTVAALLAAFILAGCGGSSSSNTNPPPPPMPSISNLNSTTSPESPVNLAIEINGAHFLSTPGQVTFSQSASGISATVTPASSAWSDTGVIAVVPTGNATTAFTVPGTLSVSVTTANGTSNSISLALVSTPSFAVNNVAWATTTPLPTAITGEGAVAIPVDSTHAWVVVAGGYNGTNDLTSVMSNNLNNDGTVGASWLTATAAALPYARAFFGMTAAHAWNSLVATGKAYVYVIAGQQNAGDAPGGTATVYMAAVDPTSGTVGTWSALNSLPQTLVGPSAAVFNGQIYVAGGLTSTGTPSNAVYSAPINADGSIGAWVAASGSGLLPTPVSFASAFAFGGNLYLINGDAAASTDPTSESNTGVNGVWYAPIHAGAVGQWVANAAVTVKARCKFVTWVANGQVINSEGIYSGAPSLELEHSSINPDGSLATWTGMTNTVNQIGANVYNAAALVSPLQSSAGSPRMLLLGGQQFASGGVGGPLSNIVYYNSMP